MEYFDDISIARRRAESMKIFAGEDDSFCLGDWRAWEAACMKEGRVLCPLSFKKLSKEEKMVYLPPRFKEIHE